MNQNKDNLFDCLTELAGFCCQAAQFLKDSLGNFSGQDLSETTAQLHSIEHKADMRKHEVLAALRSTRFPPVPRQDYIELSHAIDDVTDAIEDVLLRMYMFNVTSLRPEALPFSAMVAQCCEALRIVMQEFHRYRDSTSIHGFIVEVNRLEEEGDRLYTEAMRSLTAGSCDPLTVIAWVEVFARFVVVQLAVYTFYAVNVYRRHTAPGGAADL